MKLTGRFSMAFRIGLASVWANLVPMLLLWGGSGLFLFAYFAWPSVRDSCSVVARWQVYGGAWSAAANYALFCGVLPGVCMLLVPSIRPKRVMPVLMAQVCFCAICGMISQWMYEINAMLFGEGTDMMTLVAKTAVSQLVWTPLVFMPLGTMFYFWIGRDFSFMRVRREWPQNYLAETYLPALLMTWLIWIPVTMLVHVLPTPLQVQVSGVASACYSLAFIWLGRRS